MITPQEEKDILTFWETEKVFEARRAKNTGGPRWSFLDGPITANNPMGVHHAWGRTLKDLYQRYKALRGFDQRFQNGFDCQGLWVEVEVEKALGFNSKRDIEAYGLDKFSAANRQRVEKFAALQTEQSKRLGQWMDWEHSYFTMSERNNEFIWKFLQVCQQKGWLSQGEDAVPWCPRCGTAISHHELSDGGYAMVKHPSVYCTFPLVDEPDTALLIWTTTPWTLLANVAAAVKPTSTYVRVRNLESRIQNLGVSEKTTELILAKSRLEVIGEGWEVVDEFPGSSLVGKKYHGPFDDVVTASILNYQLPITNYHRVVAWDDVSEADGSGIVHIAPGCGKEDYELGKREGLPAIAPLDERGVYLDGFGKYTGKFAGDVTQEVLADLKHAGRLFASSEEAHSYPICWRCKTPLLFRLSGEWFIKADEIRSAMVAAAKTVTWTPPYALDRMLDWLAHMGDWPISRRRYWGLALPFYPCDCGELTVVGSKEELRQRAVDPAVVDALPELHRPWIDAVKIRCPKCASAVSRVLDVGDCWLDAGITPFSTLPGNPWAPKGSAERTEWEQWFPVDFVCEAMPQIKLWFYTLLFMSVTLESRAPYERVMAHMNVVDAKGNAMHKSAGNAIWFDDAIEKMGADVMRWMYAAGPITGNLKFGFELGDEVRRKFLVFDNVVNFFTMVSADAPVAEASANHVMDQWLFASAADVVERVTGALENFEHWKATEILAKAMDDLSTWYVRRSRDRLKTSPEARAVFADVLRVYVQLLAPFTPFTAEALFRRLRRSDDPASVHLFSWPTVPGSWRHQELIEAMEHVRSAAELAHAARARASMKLRQPLKTLALVAPALRGKTELLAVLQDEVNVKEVTVVEVLPEGDGYELERGGAIAIALDTRLDAELKNEGSVREVIRQLNALRKESGLIPSDRIHIECAPSSSALVLMCQQHEGVILRGAIGEDLTVRETATFSTQRVLSIDGESITLGIKKITE